MANSRAVDLPFPFSKHEPHLYAWIKVLCMIVVDVQCISRHWLHPYWSAPYIRAHMTSMSTGNKLSRMSDHIRQSNLTTIITFFGWSWDLLTETPHKYTYHITGSW